MFKEFSKYPESSRQFIEIPPPATLQKPKSGTGTLTGQLADRSFHENGKEDERKTQTKPASYHPRRKTP